MLKEKMEMRIAICDDEKIALEQTCNIVKDVFDEIKKNRKNAVYGGSFEKIKEIVLKEAVAGDIVITMGAGDIYKVGEELLK